MRERPVCVRLSTVFALAAGVASTPTHVGAQDYDFRPRLQWEARVDGLPGSPGAAHVGFGANVPTGYYLRVGVAVAGGPARSGNTIAGSARMDVSVRYLLDPFRETRWGAYAGSGLTSRWDDATRWRTWLLVLLGVEGPEKYGWRTAVEAGLGGGARVGIVFRRARKNGR